MPRDIMNLETTELYKRIPASRYKDARYYHGELCSNCGQNEYEDALRDIAVRHKKMRNYERHCPSCHCPLERQRSSPTSRPRTSENVEAMLNRYERVSAEPISSTIKKSQSSPLSQRVCWHNCRASVHPRCSKRLLQARRRRSCQRERDKYLSSVLRTNGDTLNSELNNEDVEAYSKYTQSIPKSYVKSSLKKYSRGREPEGSPDDQEYSDAESEASMKYTQHVHQPRKSYVSNLRSRRHFIGGDGEYIREIRDESDVGCRQKEHECQEMREPILELEDLKRLRRDEVTVSGEEDKKIERRKLDIVRAKSKKPNDTPRCVTSKPLSSGLLKESIDKPAKELILNETHLAKLDLQATKNRILDSIDHILGTMDDAKNDTSRGKPQEQTEQSKETIEKITHELQENGWQLLFNAFTIHRDSTDFSKKTVRLECLDHIRQQLDKLYALESTLDNCPPKLQSLSSHDVPCNEEYQPVEQKIADS